MIEIVARTSVGQPPGWALFQRSLFDLLADAVDVFVAAYFEEDGEPFWPPDGHVGCDGFDDIVEGFYNWPLVYAMGGHERLLTHARAVYEGALRRGARTQTPFGHPMVVNEFEHCRDWFHMGEGNLYTYNMGLAAPNDERVRERAERFAQLYFEESDTGNYDAEQRLVRGPMNGAMGPEYCDFSAYEHHPYGAQYRWARHGLPWRDLEFDSFCDLLDPDNEQRLFEILEQRCSNGDIPLNLNITSLMTNAYLHTGEDRYRDWVMAYTGVWRERTEANGGIIPDNVGLTGEIGEYTDGSWYGGYYGWSWGGWHYVGIGPIVAAENAVLLEGDREYLEFPRSQLDVLLEQAIPVDENGHDTLYIPHKHGDPGDYQYNISNVLTDDDGSVLWRDGWYEFRPHRDAPYAVHLWYMSMDKTDRTRVRRLRDWDRQPWRSVDPTPATKHGAGEEYAWLSYLDGGFPTYPERRIQASHARVHKRLERVREEGGKPTEIDEDYLRNRNPVVHRGLLQLTMGAPQPVYYGGLVMAQIRHFDADRERPGLPPGVGVLVTDVNSTGITLRLVNTGAMPQELLLQAGAYGEHRFSRIEYDDETVSPEANVVRIALPSATRLTLTAELDRFVNDPTYETPF